MLCWIGVHRWRWLFVGDHQQPNAYVKACTRCGREPS
jgi:hypothetical protein